MYTYTLSPYTNHIYTTSMHFFKKRFVLSILNIELTCDPAIHPRYLIKELKTNIQTKTCTSIAARLAIARGLKQSKCLSTNEQINSL